MWICINLEVGVAFLIFLAWQELIETRAVLQQAVDHIEVPDKEGIRLYHIYYKYWDTPLISYHTKVLNFEHLHFWVDYLQSSQSIQMPKFP